MSEATDKITLFRKFGLHASADALDCVHCGKECCNSFGWCNSYKSHASANALAARDAYREGKTCRTCVHLDSDPRGEPCARCTRFDRWQDARAEQSRPDGVAGTLNDQQEQPR